MLMARFFVENETELLLGGTSFQTDRETDTVLASRQRLLEGQSEFHQHTDDLIVHSSKLPTFGLRALRIRI
jgi:hypothetical protein